MHKQRKTTRQNMVGTIAEEMLSWMSKRGKAVRLCDSIPNLGRKRRRRIGLVGAQRAMMKLQDLGCVESVLPSGKSARESISQNMGRSALTLKSPHVEDLGCIY
jgi:hypothetical protein